MRLKTLRKSLKPAKKYDAVFIKDDGKEKVISFGAAGMSDYTKHKDEKRRELYLKRHSHREDWTKPDTAGSLSRWILWGDETSLRKNLKTFKQKFNV